MTKNSQEFGEEGTHILQLLMPASQLNLSCWWPLCVSLMVTLIVKAALFLNISNINRGVT